MAGELTTRGSLEDGTPVILSGRTFTQPLPEINWKSVTYFINSRSWEEV